MNYSKLLLCSSLVLSSQVMAIGGVGDVVSDPGAYSYYATQIEKAVEQLKTAEAQLKQATESYNMLTSIDDRVSGNLQRAMGSLQDIKKLQDLSLDDSQKALQFAGKSLEELGGIPEYMGEAEASLDKTFSDLNDSSNWVSVEAAKKSERQKALKKAILNAELAQGRTELGLKRISELSSTANTADTLKDAVDVTNSILLKSLENQQELISLMSAVSKNIALASYDGDTQVNQKIESTGKSMLNKEDYSSKGAKKPKNMNECNFMKNSNCLGVDNNPFKDAWK